MVADFNRLYVGILLLTIVCISFVFKLDLYLLYLILLFISFDLYKLKLVNNIFLIIIITFSIIFFSLINFFTIFWNNLYLIQTLLISLTIFTTKHRVILFYISLFLFCLILFYIINVDRYIFYLIIGISFFNDTVAYIFGSKIKGPLIIPKISPNKTWSGTVISIFLSTSVLFLLNINLILSLLISIFLFMGDIFFSFIKRFLNIKDFSSSLGNHGGILDRIDSMFLISIIFHFYLVSQIE